MSVESVMEGLETTGSVPVAPVAPPTTPVQPKEVHDPAEEQPKADTPEGQPTSEVTEPETEPDLEQPSEGSGDYEKFKAVFESHPELKADLKAIIGREKAFTELAPNGSFSEAREILTRIPSVADAEQIVTASENLRQLGQKFREDLPGFVEGLKESDSLAYTQFINKLPELLAETDDASYRQQSRTYNQTWIRNVAILAQQAGDQELLAAAQVLASKFNLQMNAEATAPSKDTSENARLKKLLAERDQQDSETRFNTFWSATDQEVMNSTVSQIETSINEALPNATQAQRQRMVKEAYDKTLELMNAQPQTLTQINQYRENARKGKQGIADHKQIISFINGRTKTVVPRAVKGVIDEWSKSVLKLNSSKIEKQQSIAAKSRDVGSGPQATTSAGANRSASNGKPRGVDSIIKSLAEGSYVKK